MAEKLVQVPKINWSKYDIRPVKDASSNENSDENNKQTINNRASNEPIRVRGRVYDESKPETFNQVIFFVLIVCIVLIF